MGPRDFFLYASTVLIWGTTWLAITFQLGPVPVEVSIAYRFGLAAALLAGYCLLRSLPMRFSPKEHRLMAVEGLFLFAVNYVLTYHAERFISSGLTAVGFSAIVFLNIVGTRLVFGNPITLPMAAGAVLGATGIVLVFWQDLAGFQASPSGLLGLALILGAASMSSVGNMLAAWSQKRGLPVVQSNAFGMAYGALITAAIAAAAGQEFRIDTSPAYLLSLFYLALFGTALAFGAYLSLLGRIGADRAAYASVLFPMVALGLSTWAEGFQWHPSTAAGLALSLLGNVVILRKRQRARALLE